MPVALVMPKLGLTMQEGTVLEWRCSEGDRIEKGQVVLLIESEKVEFEVEAPAAGVVRALVVPEGDTVECREVIAVLSESADETLDLESFLAEARAPKKVVRRERKTDAVRAAGDAVSRPRRDRPRASPRARRLAEREGVDLLAVEGSGPEGRVTEDDVRAAVAGLGERIELDDARIAYTDAGAADGRNPLMFVIGFGLDRSGWNLQLQHFGERRRVLAADPRGTGASTDPGDAPLTVERLAADVIALLAARGVGRVDLVGSSLGAATVLEVARAAPDRVQKLVLVNPACAPDARLAAALDSFCRAAETGEPEVRLRVMAPWLFGGAFLSRTQDAERATRAMIGAVARIPPRTLRRQAVALAAWLDAGSGTRVADISAQTLVVGGEDDVLTPLDQARALSEQLPNATLEVLPGVGHAPMVEAPDALHALIDKHT